jgi:pimeloyl-ACP methyl ester carboxylesterase
MEVREIGSFHVGGSAVHLSGLAPREIVLVPGSPPVAVDPNGDFHAGQMYVQYVRLTAPRSSCPVMMWHGGGLTGATWETTPDGRTGWQQLFLEAGCDVFVSDAVERGRAGWARYPEIYPGEPFFRSTREAWELFRVGPREGYAADPARRRAFPGQRFPIAALDAFAMQLVPRWNGTEAMALAAYLAALERIGPVVLVAHSQGGAFAFKAAIARPELVRALVLLEPGGAPPLAETDFARLSAIPTLVLWGDFIDAVPFWAEARRIVDAARCRIVEAGGDVEWLDLPAAGTRGNSHLLMMDDNAGEIAALVLDWMARKGLRVRP